MSSPRALVFLSIFLPAVLAPLEISAAELRILDSLGLTRAVKSVEKAAKVIITASIEEDKSQPADLYLSHVDGLAPDIEGTRNPDKSLLFVEVPEGVWKITAPDQHIIISEVKIVQ